MNSKYKVLKFKSNNFKNVDDLVSIEEPLEISIKYKNNDNHRACCVKSFSSKMDHLLFFNTINLLINNNSL